MPFKSAETRNAYARAYYARNPAAQKARVARLNAEIRDVNRRAIIKAKDRPCADCGTSYPSFVMDFDHVRGVKLFDIGNHARLSKTVAIVAAEIAKCDVVCANCHRLRHGGGKDKTEPVA